MIIGNGMLAKRFTPEFSDNRKIILFASGVSNSKLDDKQAFDREANLLKHFIEKYPQRKLVYFSTCSIYDPSLAGTSYIYHKLKMEKLIHETAHSYLICRTTNLVGNTANPHTIINYLVRNIRMQTSFVYWKGAYRNLLDVEDFYHVVKEIIFKIPEEDRRTVNIFHPVSYHIGKIVHAIEHHLHLKAVYSEENAGSSFKIPGLGYIMPVYERMGLQFGPGYLDRILNRYFPVNIASPVDIQLVSK